MSKISQVKSGGVYQPGDPIRTEKLHGNLNRENLIQRIINYKWGLESQWVGQ